MNNYLPIDARMNSLMNSNQTLTLYFEVSFNLKFKLYQIIKQFIKY